MQILSSDPVPTPISTSNEVSLLEDTRAASEKAPGMEKLPLSFQDAISEHSLSSSPTSSNEDHLAADRSPVPEPEGSQKGTPTSSQKSDVENHPFPLTASTPVAYLSNRRSLENSFTTPSTLGRAGDDSFRYTPPLPFHGPKMSTNQCL